MTAQTYENTGGSVVFEIPSLPEVAAGAPFKITTTNPMPSGVVHATWELEAGSPAYVATAALFADLFPRHGAKQLSQDVVPFDDGSEIAAVEASFPTADELDIDDETRERITGVVEQAIEAPFGSRA